MRAALSLTLSLYLARRYALWFLGVLFTVIAVIFVAETIELLRRSVKEEDVTLFVVLQLAAFKLPVTLQEVFPFLVLASGIGAYWHLTRSSETVAARASGVSAWQFLIPAGAVAVLIALFRVVVFDPVAAITAVRTEQMQQRYFESDVTLIASAANGLWLRTKEVDGDRIVHAAVVRPRDMLLQDVTILSFGEDSRFQARLDASTARVRNGYWLLADAREVRPSTPTMHRAVYEFPTALSVERIANSLSTAATLSFFELPQYIKLIEQTGFSARPHKVRLHRLLATPLQFLGMLLLGAGFSLRPPRLGGTAALIGLGTASGFVFYFLSSLIYNLGQTSIPAELAAWTPAVAIIMIGVALLLHLEDG